MSVPPGKRCPRRGRCDGVRWHQALRGPVTLKFKNNMLFKASVSFSRLKRCSIWALVGAIGKSIIPQLICLENYSKGKKKILQMFFIFS